MYWKTFCVTTIILFIIGLASWQGRSNSLSGKATASQPTGIAIETIHLTRADLAGGELEQLVLDESGRLRLPETAAFGRFHSPIIATPFPFNAVVPRWQVNLPPGGEIDLYVRTGNGRCDQRHAGCFWSDWYPVHAHGDWTLPGAAQQVGDMVFVNGGGGAENAGNDERGPTHTHLQFALEFYGASATLAGIEFTFIDSSRGPTTAELLARQPAQSVSESTTGYSKPAVIGRELWCDEPACLEEVSFSYYPVSHLILHHTATSNQHQDWAAIVRAIWGYHTFTLGWGDIGYHYLVDVHGNIYEGRQGGDDVVGVHAGPANTGSMGVAMLGTFTLPDDDPPGIAPPAPMLNSVANLFAWKADQRQIDVFDASKSLPNMTWGLPHLMSHRDVFGGLGTTCPGDQAHTLLPWLRQEVANRINFESPYIYIDELSEQFAMSGNFWNVPEFGCGNNGHAFYAWSVTDPAQSRHWGEWSLNVPENGRYELQVHIPYCYTGAAETMGARYTVYHTHGSSQVVINQDARVGQWASLGSFDFTPGQGKLRLTNLTSTDTDRGVWFDAIRFRLALPVATLQSPTAGSWHNQLSLTFAWQIANPGSVIETRWQVATDSSFNNLVADLVWDTAVSQHSHTFDQPYPQLYWRVLLTPDPLTGLTEAVVSAIHLFGLDLTPPESAVNGIYELPNGNYILTWSGQDDLSGVAAYHIDYRPLGETEWTRWLTATTATAANFTPLWPGQQVAFRSQAIDHAGNLEPPHPQPDITTEQAIFLPHAIMLPIVKR
jgi:hypothetical protein